MNNTRTSHVRRLLVLLATGALLSNAACGGDSNDPSTQSGAGTSSDDSGGSNVGGAGGSSGKSPGGGRSGAGASNGGSDEGGSTAGGSAAGGSTAGTAGKASTTCDRDSDCIACAYDKAPATKTECYCVTCASTALSKAQCSANQAQFEKICADVVLPCPAIRCLPPADPVCESNLCVME
jgi:hypothetical protein